MPIVIDAHSDILQDILGRRAAGQKAVLRSIWLPAMDAAGIEVRVVALYNPPPELALRRSPGMRKGAYLSVAGLERDADVPKIPKLLAARGYDEKTIEGIMGGNFLRVFREVLQ